MRGFELAKFFQILKKFDFQDTFAEQQIKILADINRILVCDRMESLCQACAKIRQLNDL